MNYIPLAEASEKLPELLEKVEQGENFAITRDGKTIARLLPRDTKRDPYDPDALTDEEWKEAHRRLMARLDKGAHLGGFRFNREEFYGRDNEKIIA